MFENTIKFNWFDHLIFIFRTNLDNPFFLKTCYVNKRLKRSHGFLKQVFEFVLYKT